MNNILGSILIIAGLIFDFVGCLGLIRLPDVYNRLQASTKCVTFGTCSILLGTLLIIGFCTAGVKCILAIAFLLFTSPTASHALIRAACKANVKLSDKNLTNEYKQ
ncbi:MAG: monovalent cation/H(+) antiporter subunit G [Candidatus Omnitrophica bacterium]|nr:monovalent cation/H(+) antiporter subunit G [Candidatus Omnitrophota bacterium]